jgi:hypothetical protein
VFHSESDKADFDKLSLPSRWSSVFGMAAFGQSEPICRILNGVDEDLLKIWEDWWDNVKLRNPDTIKEDLPFPKHDAEDTLERFKWKLRCDQMSLQEAIDCATYWVGMVIGLHRFWILPPTCGGEIALAVITRTGYEEIKAKP